MQANEPELSVVRLHNAMLLIATALGNFRNGIV